MPRKTFDVTAAWKDKTQGLITVKARISWLCFMVTYRIHLSSVNRCSGRSPKFLSNNHMICVTVELFKIISATIKLAYGVDSHDFRNFRYWYRYVVQVRVWPSCFFKSSFLDFPRFLLCSNA